MAAVSPALLWHFDEAGWNVLGYKYAPGRHADYRPGSPDPDRIVQLMEALGRVAVPPDTGPFKRAEDRWKTYVDDPGDALLFAGQILTHTDWAPDNLLTAPRCPLRSRLLRVPGAVNAVPRGGRGCAGRVHVDSPPGSR